MKESLQILKSRPQAKLLWASPRELLNLVQADQIGCHVITVTPDILKKLPMLGKDLAQLSLETVQMFHNDAQKAGFSLRTDFKVARVGVHRVDGNTTFDLASIGKGKR
jgi:transaldolase